MVILWDHVGLFTEHLSVYTVIPSELSQNMVTYLLHISDCHLLCFKGGYQLYLVLCV